VRKTRSLSLANLKRFRQLLGTLRPDLLLTYNWGAIEWAIANRWRPLCRHLHFEDGFGPQESPSRQSGRRVLTRPAGIVGTQHIIVPSRTLYDLATGRWRIAPDHVIHLPNGIDCSRFAQPPDAELMQNWAWTGPEL